MMRTLIQKGTSAVLTVAIGIGRFAMGVVTTFVLGLGFILIGGVMYSQPTTVVDFMVAYSLLLLLFKFSCFAGIVIFIRRVYSFRDPSFAAFE
jgi:hypothetical protein